MQMFSWRFPSKIFERMFYVDKSAFLNVYQCKNGISMVLKWAY